MRKLSEKIPSQVKDFVRFDFKMSRIPDVERWVNPSSAIVDDYNDMILIKIIISIEYKYNNKSDDNEDGYRKWTGMSTIWTSEYPPMPEIQHLQFVGFLSNKYLHNSKISSEEHNTHDGKGLETGQFPYYVTQSNH